MNGAWIVLADDDSIENIAFRNGLLPETLWQHEQNGALREQRSSMHVLLAGDRLFVPAIKRGAFDRPTGRTHCFRRRSVPTTLSLKIAIGQQALANRPCRVVLPGRAPISTQTDDQGFVKVPVLPDAGPGTLDVGLASGQVLTVALAPRLLDPVDTLSGAHGRLRNLGFASFDFPGSMTLPLVFALSRFQRFSGLEMSGKLDEPTQAALLRVHGS